MKLPRDISGRALADALIRHWGHRKVNQVGSHIIPQADDPRHHRLSVPDHAALRIGTLNAIPRSAADAKGVLREDIVEKL